MAQKIGSDKFPFGPWVAEASNGPILGQEGIQKLEEKLEMLSLPDMIFDKNSLTLKYKDSFSISFAAEDALNTCNKNTCPDIQVSAADSWI